MLLTWKRFFERCSILPYLAHIKFHQLVDCSWMANIPIDSHGFVYTSFDNRHPNDMQISRRQSKRVFYDRWFIAKKTVSWLRSNNQTTLFVEIEDNTRKDVIEWFDDCRFIIETFPSTLTKRLAKRMRMESKWQFFYTRRNPLNRLDYIETTYLWAL